MAHSSPIKTQKGVNRWTRDVAQMEGLPSTQEALGVHSWHAQVMWSRRTRSSRLWLQWVRSQPGLQWNNSCEMFLTLYSLTNRSPLCVWMRTLTSVSEWEPLNCFHTTLSWYKSSGGPLSGGAKLSIGRKLVKGKSNWKWILLEPTFHVQVRIMLYIFKDLN